MDLQTLLANPRARLGAAAAAGVVVLALVMRSRSAKKDTGGAAVNMVPPANPPTSTADINQALAGLNGATQSLVTAIDGLNNPAAPATPVTTPAASAGGGDPEMGPFRAQAASARTALQQAVTAYGGLRVAAGAPSAFGGAQRPTVTVPTFGR